MTKFRSSGRCDPADLCTLVFELIVYVDAELHDAKLTYVQILLEDVISDLFIGINCDTCPSQS